ncbi:hypothetical protein [Isoptericola sp. NPDC057391]|uniref:hypothetical protein n=1 Tax=Isoptericola sp. NPDC057391 TaxID=3346117 RepID=UPI0036349BFC
MGTEPSSDVERLYDAARFHAHAAMSLGGTGLSEHASLDLATRCGSVVELLAKAVLAACDARLLTKNDAHHHLLDLALNARGQSPAVAAATKLKTSVDASIAVRVAARIDQRLIDTTARADRVLRARNAAVHMAIPLTATQCTALLDDMAVVASSTVAVLRRTPADFWADHLSAATARVATSTTKVRAVAEGKVAKAGDAFRRLRAQVGDQAWDGVLTVLRRRPAHASDVEASMQCPACLDDAQVSWTAEADADWSDGEIVMYGYWALDGLSCPVCGLELDGEELEAIDLPDLPDPGDAAAEMDDHFDDWREYAD